MRLTSLYTTRPASALAFYAHPDDADVSCGATLALWASQGSVVHLVVCTKGEKGTVDGSVDPETLELERIREVQESFAVLELADLLHLSIPDGEVVNSLALREQLVGLIRSLKPEAVLCPDPTAVFFGAGYFNHRDHRELGWAVLDAVSPASALPHYFPDQGDAHQVSTVLLSGSLEADAIIDVSQAIEKKIEAVLCHRSQIGERGDWMRDVIATRARETGRPIGADFAEAFRVLELGI